MWGPYRVVRLLDGAPIIAAHTFTFRMGEVTQIVAQANYKLLAHLQYIAIGNKLLN